MRARSERGKKGRSSFLLSFSLTLKTQAQTRVVGIHSLYHSHATPPMYHHLQHSRNTDSDSDEEEEEDHPITWATVSVLPTIPTTTITTTTTTSASTLPKHNTISTESHPIITPRPFRKQKRIISSNQHLPIDQTTLKTIRLLAMRLSGKERDSHHITPPTG